MSAPAKLNTSRISSVLDALFNGKGPDTARLYNHLKQQRRIQSAFHVTLIHRASAAHNQQYWDKLIKLNDTVQATQENGAAWEPELGKCDVLLERLIWDDRIMCFVVRLNSYFVT